MTGLDPAVFHFLRPGWLVGVLPAVWIAVRYLRRRNAGSDWRSTIEPALLSVLLEGTAAQRRRMLATLVGISLALASVGVAGPTFTRLPQPVEQRNDAVVVVLDLSLSMLVPDTSPSRIVRARHKIADLLDLRDEGFVGLVAYAGDAHIVSPLTDDKRTVTNLLSALSPEMMPVLGSEPEDAIVQAHQLLKNAGIAQGRIILLTDGIERISDVTRHATRSVPISILGIGTQRGAPIPLDFADQPGQVLRDDQGRPVIAKLDTERLETVAELCHGRFAELAIGDGDLRYLLDTPLPGPADTTEVERQFDTWADAGYWIAVALLPLGLLAFRRGVVVALVFVIAMPADASWWDDLWERRDQQGFHALQRGEPERAAALFRDPLWQGVANYRSDSYDQAVEAFGTDPTATGHYNRGNALAHAGRIEDAIAAYDTALTLAPGHEDAVFNKALLERQQQQQQQASDGQQADQSGSPSPEGNSGQDPSNANGATPEPRDGQSDQQTEAPDSDSAQQLAEGEPPTDQGRDELDDAAEQWLRRVPDNPGGLLRRKFQYETNQRLRRGEYRSRQEDRIW